MTLRKKEFVVRSLEPALTFSYPFLVACLFKYPAAVQVQDFFFYMLYGRRSLSLQRGV